MIKDKYHDCDVCFRTWKHPANLSACITRVSSYPTCDPNGAVPSWEFVYDPFTQWIIDVKKEEQS